ncbi:MAG: c-type cytochrome [Pseudomonadota bacterium]
MRLRLFALALIIATPFAMAAERPSKEVQCRACHGPGGGKPIMALYPKLNGQNEAYLIEAMKAYREGRRKGTNAMQMAVQSKTLSDADIEALAKYYAAQP